jgi:hypothetical protein
MKTADETVIRAHGVRIASRDFSHATECVRLLLKRRWFKPLFMRRSDAAVQQFALVTALVISYARPFGRNKGFGRFDVALAGFSPEEALMHDRLLHMRDTLYAHSDHGGYEWVPWVTPHFVTAIETAPDFSIPEATLQVIARMLGKLLAAARSMQVQA